MIHGDVKGSVRGIVIFPQIQPQYGVDVQHVNLNPWRGVSCQSYIALCAIYPHLSGVPVVVYSVGSIRRIWEIISLSDVPNTKSEKKYQTIR